MRSSIMSLLRSMESDQDKEQNLKTTLYILRHGPTSWNVEGRIQGNVDIDILPDRIDGYLQKVGAESLPCPDAFVVSGLKRTEQTARAILAYRQWNEGIPVYKDERLNERRWGIFEGVSDREARQRARLDPELRKEFPKIQTEEDVDTAWETYFKAPGGESIPEVAARVLPVLQEITDRFTGKKIIVVLHAGVLISLGLDLNGISECHPSVTDQNGFVLKG